MGVSVCGVCRTDLHLADHDLRPSGPGMVPGHEVVGEVVALGEHARRFRIGIAWLRRTCGVCRACRRGRENLCRASECTGWSQDGGFAEYAVVPEAFAYVLPPQPSLATRP
ncbi:MAG: alcohol dehydrogenase catalytic domain-containing protein [Propionibacteriales bacterium]|nr:alcohol dehydrogenase catalytic domain-containing protein [Propionibacteriales bacterium]